MTGLDRYRARKMAWLKRCGLQREECWPLFDVEKFKSASDQVWVVLSHLPPVPADGWRHLYHELRRLEYRLESEGIVGWIQAIRKGNYRMRRWTEMVGAQYYAEDDARWYFKKVVGGDRLPASLSSLVRGAHHGHA